MPFSEKQKQLIEKHLYADDVGGEPLTTTIRVDRRGLRFLLQAIQYYHDTCCPGLGEGDECAGMGWGEDVHSGALESACFLNCMDWVNELLSPEVLAAFPPRSAAR